MKKIIIFFLFVCSFAIPAIGQISTCTNINGYWGKWIQPWGIEVTGNVDDFVIYPDGFHPSDYYFRVVITNYNQPTKEEMRLHKKKNMWYTYTGYVEYFVSINSRGNWDTVDSVVRGFPNNGGRAARASFGKKKTSKATIKIEPYKKSPRVYNIWFEGYGVGIQLY